jgi:hypothetical protein
VAARLVPALARLIRLVAVDEVDAVAPPTRPVAAAVVADAVAARLIRRRGAVAPVPQERLAQPVRLPVEVPLIRRVVAVAQVAAAAVAVELHSRRGCELAPDGASRLCVPTRR